MQVLEETTEKMHDGYFVDLFVRKSNTVAISMYEKVRATLTSAYQELNVLALQSFSLPHYVSTHLHLQRMGMQFGYTVYRRVIGYYSGDEDAYDMRKAMPRDKRKESMIPMKRPIYPDELEYD
jgi:N-terminal acetyltransferase B complex catalytic subunit